MATDDVWVDDAVVEQTAQDVCDDVLWPLIAERVKKYMNQTITDAVKEYVEDGVFDGLSGEGTNLEVLFLPFDLLDQFSKSVPLIQILESELESLAPWDNGKPILDPVDDEYSRRRNLILALIKAYDENGGERPKP